jgi:hypothetical protein
MERTVNAQMGVLQVDRGPRHRRNVLVVAVVCFVAVVASMFVSERVGGRLSWHLPDGGRVHLSRAGGHYTLTKIGTGGGFTTLSIESADEIGDAELRTDDAGSYWLVDRKSRRVVGFFAASDGLHIGAVPDPTPPETFSVDGGRVIERSLFFGLF